MIRLVQLAAEIQSFLDAQAWPNCLNGGLVLPPWGEPRLTKDVDMTVLTGFGGEERLGAAKEAPDLLLRLEERRRKVAGLS